MIELAEMIGELRRELQQAMDIGAGELLRFELGPVELELEVAVQQTGGGQAKVRFWVVEFGGDAKVGQSSMQHLKLALQPRMASGGSIMVAGDEVPGER